VPLAFPLINSPASLSYLPSPGIHPRRQYMLSLLIPSPAR
jgi:hypothetical protein